MTDKEMLELAAKAGRIEVTVYDRAGWEGQTVIRGHAWNPLAYDEDRYRLAKELHMQVYFDVGVRVFTPEGELIEVLIGIDEPDIDRCIVRAAAEIGRSMK